MKLPDSQSICCILGAGYSHVAGVPLTRDLFASREVAVSSDAAAHRFGAVWKDHEAWLSENPTKNPEEYLTDLLKHGQSAAWTGCRVTPPFAWAVELLGAALATPLPSDKTAKDFRSYCGAPNFPGPTRVITWNWRVRSLSTNCTARSIGPAQETGWNCSRISVPHFVAVAMRRLSHQFPKNRYRLGYGKSGVAPKRNSLELRYGSFVGIHCRHTTER